MAPNDKFIPVITAMIQVNEQTNFINGLKAKNGLLSSSREGGGLAGKPY